MSKRLVLLFLFLGMSVYGCSNGIDIPQRPVAQTPDPDPDPEPDPDPVPEPNPVDFSGFWYSRTENNLVNCGLGVVVDAQATLVSQVGNDITLLTSTGSTLVGTVSGDIVEWTGDFDERGGTATFTSATLTVLVDEATGNAAWTWTDGVDSCNGTMDINSNRNAATDEISPNSGPHIAHAFGFTDSVAFLTGTVHETADDKDYFSFVAAADGTVQVELSHFDVLASDLDLEILDENSNPLAISSSTDGFELAEAPVVAGMTYFIGVLAISTPDVQAYQLSIDVN